MAPGRKVRLPATLSVLLTVPGAKVAPLCNVVVPTWPVPCSNAPLASVKVPPSLPVEARSSTPDCTSVLPV
ncbi:hypothetical protein D3C78_1357320 [compost metagenome]